MLACKIYGQKTNQRTFATLEIHSQSSSNPAANVSSLSNIAVFEPEVFHQLINDPGDVLHRVVSIQRRTRRKDISRERGHNQVIGQVAWIEFLFEQF